MGFTFVSTDTHICHTKDEVQVIAHRVNPLEGSIECERDVREALEEYHMGVLYRHEQVTYNWTIACVDGEWRRVNGQHTSRVFLRDDLDWSLVAFPVVIHEDRYACDTGRDRAVLYAQFDTSRGKRNTRDNVRPHLAINVDLAGFNDYAIVRAGKGLQWYYHKVDRDKRIATDERTQFDVLYLGGDTVPFFHFCDSLGIEPRKRTDISSPAVLAAIYRTTRQGGSEDEAFWRQVSGGKGSIMDVTCHAFQLAEFLEKAKDKQADWTASLRNKFANKKHPNEEEVYSTCLRLFWGFKNNRPVEVFEKLGGRNMQEVSNKLWPLARLAA